MASSSTTSGMWDGVTRTWSNETPGDGPQPAPRSNFGMAYDPCGTESSFMAGTLISDTWEWNPETRTWATFPNASGLDYGGRSGSQMAFDPYLGRVVLFGGRVYWGEMYSNTWTWDGTTWTQLGVTGPAGRQGHVMTTDLARSKVVLYGGSGASTKRGNGMASCGRRSTSGLPQRSYGAAAYDAVRGVSVLFGGSCGQHLLPATRGSGPVRAGCCCRCRPSPPALGVGGRL